MKTVEKVAKVSKRVGEVSSKYAYDPEQFTRDMQRHEQEQKELYEDFKEFIRQKKVDPLKFRSLFMKYYEEFIK